MNQIGNEVLKEPISKTGMAAIISIELVFLHSPVKKLVILKLLLFLDPIQTFCLKIAKTKNCQNWKLLELKAAKIASCQNWKLPKLKIAKLLNCQNLKLPKIKVAKIKKYQNWKLTKLKVVKIENF